MNDDYVIEPVFDVPHVYKEQNWTTLDYLNKRKKDKEFTVSSGSYKDDGGSYEIKAILEDYSDLDKIVGLQSKWTMILLNILFNNQRNFRRIF